MELNLRITETTARSALRSMARFLTDLAGDSVVALVKDDNERVEWPSDPTTKPLPEGSDDNAAVVEAPPAEAEKPKRSTTRKPKAEPVAEQSAPETAPEPARAPQPVADLGNPTVEDCRAALQQLIASKGTEAGRAALNAFKKADGTDAQKISDLQATDYAEFVKKCGGSK